MKTASLHQTDADINQPVTAHIHRTPLYFGAEVDPLFGWCHTPQYGSQSRLGMVICPPLGHEYVHTHRSLRHLADHFAADGIPAMRLDYQGTGDSGGIDEDPDRITAWLNSIRLAMNVLRAEFGCEQVGLVGLRLGGTLASAIASETDLACLVLWAPCVQGRHYVREMKALQFTGEENSNNLPDTSREIESAGFILSEQTIEGLGALNLVKIIPRPTRILIVARDDLAEDKGLTEIWSAQGLQVEVQRLSGYIDMLATPHNTKVPVDAIRKIVTWVHAGATMQQSEGVPLSPSRLRNEAIIGPRSYTVDAENSVNIAVRERLFQFDKNRKLFGIISEPIHSGTSSRPIVLLLNAGAVHHIGANRLYVLLARNLAKSGYRCMRMDLSGLGDSIIDNIEKENNSYTTESIPGILSAIQALKQTYQAESFVVTGVCSGAHAAFHAGLELVDEPIAECLLINPLTFYWKDGMSLEVTQAEHFSNWNQYKKALRQWSRWKKFLRGDVDIGAIVAAINEKVRVQLAGKLKAINRIFNKSDRLTHNSDDLETDITKLLETGRKLDFIFSDMDPGYDLLMAHAGRKVMNLLKERRVSIEFIQNANHTFTSRSARQDVIGRITTHIVNRYGDRESAVRL